MLAIRMQRTGRKGHASYRVVVQDTRRTPTSGRVVAQLGHYDPHTKVSKIDTKKAIFYLTNGAQPSERVARLIQKEGVKLPDWVTLSAHKARKTRNPEKLRSQQPKEEIAEVVAETTKEEVSEELHTETPEVIETETSSKEDEK